MSWTASFRPDLELPFTRDAQMGWRASHDRLQSCRGAQSRNVEAVMGRMAEKGQFGSSGNGEVPLRPLKLQTRWKAWHLRNITA